VTLSETAFTLATPDISHPLTATVSGASVTTRISPPSARRGS
jgi:hypothetical protein